MTTKRTGGPSVAEELRDVWKQLCQAQRDIWRAPAPVPDKTSKTKSKPEEKEKVPEVIDDNRGKVLELIAKLEDDKRNLDQQFEHSFAKTYEPLPEHNVIDFLDIYYSEIDRKERRNSQYLQRLYFSQASMLIVGVGTLKGSNQIAECILVRALHLCEYYSLLN